MIRATSILKSIQQGLLICNKQGKIVYFNDAYGTFIGEKLEDVVGTPIKNIRPGSIVTSIDKEKLKSKSKKTLQERVKQFEKKEIEEMLFLYGYDTEGKRKAAKELGISLATLYNKLQF